jgi:DME family drug/metabolite transporter
VIWVMLLSPIVVKEPLRARDGIAIAVAFAGMALFFVGKLRVGGAGDLIALSSGIFWAGLVLSLRRERNGGAEAVVTYGNILTAAALLPFLAGNLSLSPRSALLLLFLGVVQLAAAYVLFVRGLKTVTATQASLIGMAEPVLNPVWVFLVLGEKPSGYAMVGALVVLGAIAWRTLATPSISPVPPPD